MRGRFLADLNISPLTVAELRRHGWDVMRSSQLVPATAPDTEIFELARRDGFVVITQDLDYSTLLALSGHAKPSLVTLRLTDSSPDSVTGRLLAVLPLLETGLAEGCAATVEDEAVRVRKLPIGSSRRSAAPLLIS
jgi:predicted nuclease of predicted toxin-antitoxin system